MNGLRRLGAVQVEAVTAASPAALATAINAWVVANAAQRTMVQLDYWEAGGTWVAFITYTE